MATSRRPFTVSHSLIVLIVGGLLALIGLVLAIGGVWLAALGGSIYYLFAGIGLVAAGVMMIGGRLLGGYNYLAVFALTIIWALWEVGLNPWALVPRVVGPAVLAILVLLAMPLLDPRRWRWRTAVAASAGVLALLLVGILISPGYLKLDPRGMPPALNAAMVDPSPMPVGADWPAYGGTYGAQRFSPLAQITPANVGKLERAWVYHTGDLPPKNPTDLEDNFGAETTPLKVGDSLYLCSARGIMIALDPVTGKQRWRFDPQVKDEWIPYTAACRGVAYFAQAEAAATALCAARIIEGTLDGRLIAVDARNGRPCPQFGANGQVDIKPGMGDVFPGMVSITSPPTIVRGVVVTGHQVLDGQKRSAPSGVIQGFDAVTGELKWAWDMMHPDWGKAPPPGQTYERGTPNMWTIASSDEKLGLVYLPTGNSAVDYWSGTRRPNENQFATSLVALDVTTGKPRWRFQAVHKDVWDYDFGGQASLVDFPVGGGTVPAMVLPSKQGDIYILDRRTGQSLFPVQERRVPQGGVEPGQRSASQPFSTYHTLAFPKLQERDMWGMSPIDQMICRIQYRQADYRGMYTPPRSDKRTVQYPGYNGGTDWGGVAVDPVHGIIVANYNNMPNYVRLVPRAVADKKGWAPRSEARGGSMAGSSHGAGDPQWGSPYAVSVNAGWRLPLTGLLCKQPPYGGLRAIDLRTGRTIWDRPYGTARRNGPWNIPSGLPFEIGTPNNGGSVVTRSGLIFVSAATDDLMRAIDLRTGKSLWHDALPAGGQATPMTYEANGRQYVVIMAGGHHFMETPIGDELVAYALPDR